MKKYLFLFGLFALVSCTKQLNDDAVAIRPVGEVIETYKEAGIEKETIKYTYEKPDDYFWVKAEYMDSTGKAYKTVNREFDNSRMPIKETYSDEFGPGDEIYVLHYDKETHNLISKIEYKKEIKDAAKVRETLYNYNDKKLISSQVKMYSLAENFKNVDGNNLSDSYTLRYLPLPDSRPEGEFRTAFKIEKRVKYYTPEMAEKFPTPNLKVGDIYLTNETKFDAKGFPIEYISTDPEAGTEHNFDNEYYKVETDEKGRLSVITPYCKPTKDSIAENSLQWKFSYDDKGRLIMLSEYMYNSKTSQFDLLHAKDRYNWVEPSFKQKYPELNVNTISESFCIHRQVYSKEETNIEKFNENEKIIMTKTATMDRQLPTTEVAASPAEKRTIKYEKINSSKK